MTPKEKADDLYATFRFAMAHPQAPFGIYKDDIAIQCALLSVQEILNTLNYEIRDIDVRGNILLDLIDYYREVKQELEKL